MAGNPRALSAAPDHFMAHLSITEAVPGDGWGEHVTDDGYNSR